MFLEKPLAETVEEAERAVAKARETGRKLVVGYILRHHPSWQKFVDIARGLGTPLVMRMNLNQQSSGETWAVHKHLMESLSPIVDCGVHYVDMICPMMSETAFFAKDVIGPKGCVSIVAAEASGQGHRSDDVDAHTKSDTLRVHHGALDEAGRFARADEVISMADEPGHDDLCRREQDHFLSAIRDDIDLSEHLRDAVNSLRIVLAADASVRSGNSVAL